LLFSHKFELAYFKIHIRVLTELRLPYFKGALLRGSFGKHFRQAVCIQPAVKCEDCICRQTCSYAFIFESTRLTDTGSWQASHDPHPFVLEPPLTSKRFFRPGEEFDVGLLLVGSGIDYLPHFVIAFENMGINGIGAGRGKFELISVTADTLGQDIIVYQGQNRSFVCPVPRIKTGDFNGWNFHSNLVGLNFVTPVRLQSKGRILHSDITFPIIIRAIMRRFSWLSSLYCDDLPVIPYAEILQNASAVSTAFSEIRWSSFEHYSYRQKRTIQLGGMVGKKVFQGDLSNYLPLLKLAEYLHIGKNTAFGLGKILIEEEKAEAYS